MRQLRFYIPFSLQVNLQYSIPESSARHMVRVLRLSEGDEIILFNGDNYEYVARLMDVTKKNVSVFIVSQSLVDKESALNTHLIQSLSKGDKMETSIQKAVELGVSEITPVSSERSNVSLSGERLEKKMMHWQAVIQSACEQTGRNKLPKLHSFAVLREVLDSLRANSALKLLLNPHAVVGMSEIEIAPKNVVILIGPEGGLSEVEVSYAIDCGFMPVKAGPRILRTETAGPAILSVAQARWGDMV